MKPTAVADRQGYAPINGLNMYYEIDGSGDPLVYIPPAFGCTGMKSFPMLVRKRAVISVDLQGYGRTADILDRPLSIKQHALDVITLLKHLGISKADFLGESYGGAIATMIAVLKPELVRRVATYGATFGPSQGAIDPKMLRTEQPLTPDSRSFVVQREYYQRVAPDPDYWPTFWGKLVAMKWDGFSHEELTSLKAPVLIALGDHDFVRIEHAVETFRLIPNAELAVIPDAGHYLLYSEPEKVIPMVEHFLDTPDTVVPIGNAETGFHPGETR